MELTVGFEANLSNNAHLKYRPLRTDLAKDYNKIKLFNFSTTILAALVYLVTALTHFLKRALKEALKIVILGSLSLSYHQSLSAQLIIYSA